MVLTLFSLVFIIVFPTFPMAKSLSGYIKVGDIVGFGHYEQDGDVENGKEVIEWRVLEKKDNEALLISEKILDVQLYNTDWESVTWAKCTLRKWLNKEFIKTAFGFEENQKIQESRIENKDNVEYRTKAGKDTRDKVFLLSIDEAKKYFKTEEERASEITVYGIKRLAEIQDKSEADLKEIWFGRDSKMWYWLRSPGFSRFYAANVYRDGSINESGDFVNNIYGCFRPVIRIKL